MRGNKRMMQKFRLSGVSEQDNEVISDILAYGSSSTNSTLSLSLMVE